MAEPAAGYCCGPPPMIDGGRASARPVHVERFTLPPVVGRAPFTVRLARTGVTVPVAVDRSALAIVPGAAHSCRQGFCGTCRVPVLPDGDMLICTDRGRGLVVLDR